MSPHFSLRMAGAGRVKPLSSLKALEQNLA